MKFRDISTLSDLEEKKATLKLQIGKSEKRVDTAYIIAKRHTKRKFSMVEVVKGVAGRIFSLDTLMSNPVIFFKIGSTIGKKLFSRKKI